MNQTQTQTYEPVPSEDSAPTELATLIQQVKDNPPGFCSKAANVFKFMYYASPIGYLFNRDKHRLYIEIFKAL